MPKRIPLQRVIVQREGKQIVPPLGDEFDFTAEEIEDINRMNPDAVRKVIVEDKELAKQLAAEQKAAADKQKADEAAAKKKAEDDAKAAAKNTPRTGANAGDL